MIQVLVLLLLPSNINDQFLLEAYRADSWTSMYMNFAVSELGGPPGLSSCRALPYQAHPRSPDLWRVDSTYRRLAHSGGSKGNLVMSWLSLTSILRPYSVREGTDRPYLLLRYLAQGVLAARFYLCSVFSVTLCFLTVFRIEPY